MGHFEKHKSTPQTLSQHPGTDVFTQNKSYKLSRRVKITILFGEAFMNFKAIVRLFQETIEEWNKDKASRLAAALAYYTIFSIAPLLIIVIAIAGAVLGQQQAQREIYNQLYNLVGEAGATIINNAITSASQPRQGTIASIISIAVLLFGATGLFTELKDALNTIWEVQPKPGRAMKNLVMTRILSFAVVLGIVFLLIASLVISAALQFLVNYLSNTIPGAEFLWQFVNFLLGFSITTLLFGLIFKVLPDVKMAWSDIWIGAALTSILFSFGRFLLGLYFAKTSFGSIYGAAGSLVVLLGWVYYGAQIIFFGAEFTQVYARKYGSQIVPDKNSIPLTDASRLQQGMKSNTTTENKPRNKQSSNWFNRIFQPKRSKGKSRRNNRDL
jgi:membrane protein